jgi:hypothetical protein
MKKNEVKVGHSYIAKVSNKLVQVKITAENPRGGWDATNEATGKKVRIMTAQRLRAPAGMTKAEVKAAKTAIANIAGTALAEDRLSAGAKRDLAAVRETTAAPDAQLDADVEAAKKARAEKKVDKAKGERKPSLLTLAAEVLREAGTPMDCKSIVEKVLAKGTWQTKGATPAATLYSAILREVGKAGDKARFRKTARGQFEAVAAN